MIEMNLFTKQKQNNTLKKKMVMNGEQWVGMDKPGV